VADDAELEQFRAVAAGGGAQPTPIIDRQYFHSVYFSEPSGVLFELASRDIGFDVDEPRASLGSALKLPAQHEHQRARIEPALTPIVNPRQVA
jgi:glyoxalase family protein